MINKPTYTVNCDGCMSTLYLDAPSTYPTKEQLRRQLTRSGWHVSPAGKSQHCSLCAKAVQLRQRNTKEARAEMDKIGRGGPTR